MLRLNGAPLEVLLAHSFGDRSLSELANSEIQMRSGGSLDKDRIGLSRVRSLAGDLVESFEIRNYAQHQLEFELTLELSSGFDDIFTVRGARPGARGKVQPPRFDGKALHLVYDGADGHRRATTITFDPAPDQVDGCVARYDVRLGQRDAKTIRCAIALTDTARRAERTKPRQASRTEPFDRVTIETDNPAFNHCLERSFADLRMLVMNEQGLDFFAAGVPWYVALFGRDSLVTAIETLPFGAHVAADTLRLLAKHQGRRIDDARDEQPGKIPHEIRVGERAHLGEPPPSPYYGTVDATPLFVVALGEYTRWTGDLTLFHELRRNVEQALEWIERWGDSDGDGLIDYLGRSKSSFRNQGWKDSDNSIVDSRGRIAEPPIALIEVQGYVHRAYYEAARLLRTAGDDSAAERFDTKAGEVQQRVRDAYWSPRRRYLAMAVGRGGAQADAIASNPGQALWAGVVPHDLVEPVAEKLLGPPMFSGWGIRTLAADEPAYNPIDYQVGSVWPHDNALIMAGLKRHGRDADAMAVMTGIFEAAAAFPRFRLPELFAGHGRNGASIPVRYPVACNPQAWAAGALPYMLACALGLWPDAPANRLTIQNPTLPQWLTHVRLHGLRLKHARIDLEYRRAGNVTTCSVVDVSGGDVEVAVA